MTTNAFTFLTAALDRNPHIARFRDHYRCDVQIAALSDRDINSYDNNGALCTVESARLGWSLMVGCYVKAKGEPDGSAYEHSEVVRVIVSDVGEYDVLGSRWAMNHLGEMEFEWAGAELDQLATRFTEAMHEVFCPVTGALPGP